MVGTWLGILLRRLPNRNRSVAQTNLRLCFPEMEPPQREALLAAHLDQTGQGLTELAWLWRRPAAQLMSLIVEVRGEEVLRDALDRGRGVLLIAPHLGSWELLCQYLAGVHATTVLYREPRDPTLEAILNRGRGRFGVKLVRAGAAGVRELLKRLRAGDIVGILPDQQPKRGQGEFAPFFGIPALTGVLVPRLARRTDSPAVFAFAERLPQGYRLHFTRGDPRLTDANAVIACSALNAQVEDLVRRAPAQYQWGYKRFSIRPAGEPAVYE